MRDFHIYVVCLLVYLLVLVLCLWQANCGNFFRWAKYIVVGKHEWKGEARLSLIRTRLSHMAEFWGEKFNLVTSSTKAKLIIRSYSPKSWKLFRNGWCVLRLWYGKWKRVNNALSLIDWGNKKHWNGWKFIHFSYSKIKWTVGSY